MKVLNSSNRQKRGVAMASGMFIFVIMLLLVWCDTLVFSRR
jgi:hypothetical protein